MTQGRILLGEHKGVYLLKFVGDVRVNLCVTMDTCLREVLDQQNFCSALVDLSETDGIDSTALGLLARLSLETKRRYGAVPTLVSTRGDITRILETMGFDDIFNLVDDTHLEVKKNVMVDYQEGDVLDVIAGPFAGYKMEVVSLQGDKILGQLDMFGRIVPAEFSKDQVYKKQ